MNDKKPKRPNEGRASCDWPGCTFSHDKPSVVMAHKAEHYKK